MGMNSSNGEIIEVEGGHIVRSSNRKDRHSKVYTSKGPRDRRVRLSAHTAIEFYDVQDRLGYDRPSKAVDWLMKKAKTTIDNLAELPPWHPSTRIHDTENAGPVEISMGGASEYQCQILGPLGDSNPLDPMKSLFPKCSSESNSMGFHGYPPELMAKTTNEEEDLCLSLHPFEDPQVGSNQHGSNDQNLFAGSASMRFQRMLGWENGGDMQHRGGGFIYNSPPNPSLHQLIGQSSQFSHQRGPLQFSVPIASSSSDHYSKQEAHQSSMPGEYAGFPHTPDPQRGRGWGGSS